MTAQRLDGPETIPSAVRRRHPWLRRWQIDRFWLRPNPPVMNGSRQLGLLKPRPVDLQCGNVYISWSDQCELQMRETSMSSNNRSGFNIIRFLPKDRALGAPLSTQRSSVFARRSALERGRHAAANRIPPVLQQMKTTFDCATAGWPGDHPICSATLPSVAPSAAD